MNWIGTFALDDAAIAFDSGPFHPTFQSTIVDIFNKFDLVINNAIDFEEFKGFSECIGQPIKTEKDFKEQILAAKSVSQRVTFPPCVALVFSFSFMVS